jgi:hypothetical protein
MSDVTNSPARHHNQQALAERRVELHDESLIQREDGKLGRLIRGMDKQSMTGNMDQLFQHAIGWRKDSVTVARGQKQNREVPIIEWRSIGFRAQ